MGSSARAISNRNFETASAIRAETITGSHLLNIFGYSVTKGIGIGKCYNSDVFTIGGYKWVIEYYPDGHTESFKNYISFFLRPKEEATDVKARVAFTMLQQNGVSSHSSRSSLIWTSKSTNYTHNGSFIMGYRHFVERTKFESSEYLKDDAFAIKCTVTFVKGPNLETINLDCVAIPSSHLIKHFINLLESEKGADVTFEVNGERIKAHRCVLATRSAVFNAMFFGSMKRKRTDVITVDDIEAPVFKSMLYFIYSDSLPDCAVSSDDDSEKLDLKFMAQHLLVAADRYDLERLRLMCEDILCKNLDMSTVVTTLILAEQHNCNQLKTECLKFVMKSSRSILKNCPSTSKDLRGAL